MSNIKFTLIRKFPSFHREEIKSLVKQYNDANEWSVLSNGDMQQLSDDPNNIIKDGKNGQIIMSKTKCKYLGQLINNKGLTENIMGAKIFGKLINKLNICKGFTKATKIRIFKTYLISKVNHLLPLIALTGNIEVSWKTIRKIIFKHV